MGDNLLGDGLQVPDPVFPGASDGENDMAGTGVDIFLKPGDAAFHWAQQAVSLYDIPEPTTV
jgi:hypothetical protein